MCNDADHQLVIDLFKIIGVITAHKAVAVHNLNASVQNVRTVAANIKHDVVLFDAVRYRRQHNVRLTLKKQRLHRASYGKKRHASAVT